MNYNRLNLYKHYGQFDNVVNITLHKDSESCIKYKQNFTGELCYSDAERAFLQNKLDSGELFEEHGKVKVRIRVNEFNHNQKYDLLYEGINTVDILSVFSIPFSTSNDYLSKTIRELPKPTIIKFDASKFDEPRAMISVFEQMKRLGKLTQFETEQIIAYKAILNNYSIPEEINSSEYLSTETGLINDDIMFSILEYKFLHNKLTPDEDVEFKKNIDRRTSKRIEILWRELKIANNNKLDIVKNYPEIISHLTVLIAFFKPQRLSYTKVPVWWDLERYLHIFLRHVSELQIGEHFKTKSIIQYKLKDIQDLIKIVLGQISEEINLHFDKYPEKDFKRQGAMSYYYNGDYYVIHINTTGLLMTFYKNN